MINTQPPFNCLTENVFEAFCDNVFDGVHEIASRKGITLTDAGAETITDQLADALPLTEPLRFMRDDPAARNTVRTEVCVALDVHMAEKFSELYVGMFGAPSRPIAMAHIRRALRHVLPQGVDGTFAKWPPLVAASLLPHLTTRIDGLFTNWGDAMTVTYHRGFMLDRDSADGPALTVFYQDGRHELEYWRGGVLHRDPAQGPAIISRQSTDGKIASEEYYVDGIMHRDDGPACIHYDSNDGKMTYCAYYRNGVAHRDDGPAIVLGNSNGTHAGEYWYANDCLHRADAPAVIERDMDGTITLEVFWHNGIRTDVTVDTHGVFHGQ